MQSCELPNLKDVSSFICMLHAAGRIKGGYTKLRGPGRPSLGGLFSLVENMTVCELMRHLPDDGRRSDRKKKEQ